jgi:hypothetical protein
MRPFGGPVLYIANVGPEPCLDLRHDPWAVMFEEFTFEREDFGEGQLDHDIFQDLASVFATCGYRWVRWGSEGGPEWDEWMYLGDDPVAARVDSDGS